MKTIAPINPFSSRFISPLTSDYLQHESERQKLDQAVRQIQDEKFLQIVGQHGSGKTMAAIEIAKRIGEGCEAIRLITVKPGMSWLHSIIVSDQLDDHTTSQGLETAKRKTEVTILDGLEQLNFVARICLIMSLRNSSDYVIVTTHRPLWFLGTPIHVRPDTRTFLPDCFETCPCFLVQIR